MAKHWRCVIGIHDWRLVESTRHDRYSECVRCGKHDWVRHLNRQVGGRSAGNLPPGG